MKGLIIPSLVILATGILIEVAYADSDRDATIAERDRVVQVLKQGCRSVDSVNVEDNHYHVTMAKSTTGF